MTSDHGDPAEALDAEVPAPAEVDLGRVWLGVAAQVWRRDPGAVERLLRRLLRSPGLARALLATPSLLLPWLLASVAVLGVGAVVTSGTGQPVVALLAPAVAGAGVAFAYGPGMDPAWELASSMAVSDRMVLLVRVLTVFGVNAVLCSAASAVSSTAGGIALGWLLPMTAVSAFALAGASVTRSANLGAALGLTGWTVTVLAGRTGSGWFGTAVTDSAFFLPYAATAVGCCVVVLFTHRTAKESPWLGKHL